MVCSAEREEFSAEGGGDAEHNKVSPVGGREKHRFFYLTYFHPIWTTRWEVMCRKFLWFVSVHERCIRKKTKQNKTRKVHSLYLREYVRAVDLGEMVGYII